MSIFQDREGLLKRCGLYIKNRVSTFLYHFSKLKTTSKIRSHGRFIATSYDLCAVITAWILSCWILIDTISDISSTAHAFGNTWSGNDDKLTNTLFLISLYWKLMLSDLFWVSVAQILLFRYFGLYRGFWRFASIQDLRKILYVSVLGGLAAWAVLLAQNIGILPGMIILNASTINHPILFPPYTIALLYSIFLGLFLSTARLFVRFAKNYRYHYGDCRRVIIIGAGNAGEGLVRDLLRDETHRYKPIAFLDDDLQKRGREIHNVRVIGTIGELPKLITKYDIDLVLIAIPSASSASMRSVVEVCEKAKVSCYTLPGLKDLANGRVSINILRSVSLEDLLGRYPVTCNWSSIKTHLQNKTILVTGGGGSIGSELCRQIASLGDITQLVIVDNNEYNLYAIDMELRHKFPNYKLHSILLSVTDNAGIKATLEKYLPEIVFHAAAYKHVPLLESQPRVAIYNNLIGTKVIAEESVKAGVKTFVLISSDKAVNPTNIMGTTKRAAEYFCQNLNDEAQKTRFITVRFGNVLDSAGSVIPLFRKQIESGGPVTVTHPEITRYFMTIPEATQLILQAAFLGQGGEILVLDMGDPIKINYLAEQMIKLAGKVVDKDIKITYTGLRPGEKLYEECFYPEETLQPTTHTKILRAQSQKRDFAEILAICKRLESHCELLDVNNNQLVNLLKKLVPEYQNENIVLMHTEEVNC